MNCLKCGRTVPDQILLCPECLCVNNAPAKKRLEPLQEEFQKQQVKKLRGKLRQLRLLLAIFLVLALAATVLLVGQRQLLQQQNSRMESQTSRINSLETAMQELQNALEQANALNDTTKDALADAQQSLDAYEAYTGLTPDKIVTDPRQPE